MLRQGRIGIVRHGVGIPRLGLAARTIGAAARECHPGRTQHRATGWRRRPRPAPRRRRTSARSPRARRSTTPKRSAIAAGSSTTSRAARVPLPSGPCSVLADPHVDRARVAGPDQRRLDALGRRVGLALLEDALEEDRAVLQVDPDPGGALGDDDERQAARASPATCGRPPRCRARPPSTSAGTCDAGRDLGRGRGRSRRRAARAGRSCPGRARRSGRRAAPGSAPRAPAGGRGRRARSPPPGSRARSAPAPSSAGALGRAERRRPRPPPAAGPRPGRTAPAGCSAAPSSRRSRARRPGATSTRSEPIAESGIAGSPPRPRSRASGKSGRKPPGIGCAAASRRPPCACACAAGVADEAALLAEAVEDLVRVEPEVARVGAHVAGDEARVREDLGLGVLDRGDVGGLDPQVALDVEQRLAERRPLAAQLVAEGELVGAVAPRPRVVRRVAHGSAWRPLYSCPARITPAANHARRLVLLLRDRIMFLSAWAARRLFRIAAKVAANGRSTRRTRAGPRPQ